MVANLLFASTRRLSILSSSSSFINNSKLLSQVPLATINASRIRSPINIIKRFDSSRSSEASLDASEVSLLDPSGESSSLSSPSSSPSSPSLSLWERVKKNTGLSTLIPEWKLMFSKENLVNDLMAGVTVGCVAMPLSLAIALASGVSPEVGLTSAIVGGSIACLLGGAPLGVTGPSLATTVLLSTVASNFGISALVFVTCATGGLQVLSGVFKLGRLVQFVPQPVIAGFTAGVGGVMLIGQLPRVLGIAGPSSPGILEMGSHVLSQLSNVHPASVVLSLGTLATTMLLPKFLPKVPASLVAVAGAATINVVLGLGVPVIGAINCAFPIPSIPSLPDLETMYSLVGASLTLYGLTSLESLLSGSAADKIDKADLRKHEPNVELVGQGLSNMAVACFGGIPVTGAIARTSLNIHAGAKTRRASLFHVAVLGATFAISPVVGMIPMAALSGILLSVAFRLLNPNELKFLSKVSYREVLPLGATFATVMASDLVTGVQVGISTAAILQIARRNSPKLLSSEVAADDGCKFNLSGDVTFISASKITELQEQLEAVPINSESPVTINFRQVLEFDATAGEMIVDMITYLEESGHTPQTLRITGLSRECKRILILCDSRNIVSKYIVKSKSCSK
jgi:carbonic anhydrase